MDTQPTFGLKDLLAHLVGDIANALCERHGEPQHQQISRARAAAQAILAFLPGDAIEAMIAGHCVMFHELIVDSIRTTMRGGTDATRRATRSGIVAMDKAFGTNLIRLEDYRTRHAAGLPEAQPTDTCAETEIADRIKRHQSGTPDAQAASGQTPSAPEPESTILHDPSPEAAAAWFGQADSVDQPYLPATAPMAGPNRKARREIVRRSRKRGIPLAPGPALARSPGVTPTYNGSATTASATAAG
jgi:hypothetical protein